MKRIFLKLIRFIILIIVVLIVIKGAYSLGIIQKKLDLSTIYIDAGHGGYDSGAVGYNGNYEKDISLQLALVIGDKLKENGFNVIYTRVDDNIPKFNKEIDDLRWRTNKANRTNAGIFLSIHLNAFEDSEANGIETWYRKEHLEGEALSKIVQENLVNVGYGKDRGLKSTEKKSIYVLNRAHAIPVLIEFGFITNQSDCEKLMSREVQEKIGESIVNSLKEYLKDK